MRDWAHHRLSVTADAARTVARALGRGFPIGPMAAPPEHIAASSKPARVNASHAPSRRARPARPSGRQLSLSSCVAHKKWYSRYGLNPHWRRNSCIDRTTDRGPHTRRNAPWHRCRTVAMDLEPQILEFWFLVSGWHHSLRHNPR